MVGQGRPNTRRRRFASRVGLAVLVMLGLLVAARRAPGDVLRISTEREPLIFNAGETWNVSVDPRLLPVAAGTTVYLKCRLLAARGAAEFWSEEHTVKTTDPETTAPSVPLDVKL